MNDDEIRAHVEEARTIVLALAASQVGDHNFLSQAEIMDQLDKLEDDPQLLYTVLRMFSALSATFAGNVAERAGKPSRSAEWESVALEAIRVVLDNIEWTARPVDDDDT